MIRARPIHFLNTVLALAVTLAVCSVGAAVDAHAGEESHKEPKHHLSVVGGVTLIPEGKEEPGDDFVLAPTLGVEYEYEINHRWAMAGMADVEFEEYAVDMDGGDLKRENVFILAVVAMYQVVPRFLVYAGPGYEIETNEDFFCDTYGCEIRVRARQPVGYHTHR
jgi:hypothetical protein